MLREQIDSDLKNAMKEKNETVLSTLRMLKSAVKNKEIEKLGKSLTDQEFAEVVQKQIKQRRDSIADFEKAKREDLVKKEKAELAVLEQYLPKQLNDQELKSIIINTIQKLGVKSKSEMGKVMKEVIPQVAGRADGKRISQFVQEVLQ